jgi:hypothetical protein
MVLIADRCRDIRGITAAMQSFEVEIRAKLNRIFSETMWINVTAAVTFHDKLQDANLAVSSAVYNGMSHTSPASQSQQDPQSTVWIKITYAVTSYDKLSELAGGWSRAVAQWDCSRRRHELHRQPIISAASRPAAAASPLNTIARRRSGRKACCPLTMGHHKGSQRNQTTSATSSQR